VFRLLDGALRIVAFGVFALLFFVAKYPVEAACIAVGLSILAVLRLQTERDRLYRLDVAAMSPIEYERYCAEVLRRAGWRVRHVGRQGDQGVDVLAELRGTRAAVQCKRYSGRAGNDAVQQVVAGKRLHGAQIAVVVAPFGYTRAAEQLAHANAALLMSHSDLARLESVARVP
jgi:HJR/Mrr/RecB family endonuclease